MASRTRHNRIGRIIFRCRKEDFDLAERDGERVLIAPFFIIISKLYMMMTIEYLELRMDERRGRGKLEREMEINYH